MKKISLIAIFIFFGITILNAQETKLIKVRPTEIFDVLNNPGIGFTTFQRFNGDDLNVPGSYPGGGDWNEGLPIEYQPFDGDLTNKNHPQTSIAYFRVDWAYVETEPGVYNWAMIDKALKTAAERGQTLMFRVAPYTDTKDDQFGIPAWFRKMVGKPKKELTEGWSFDPEDPRYLKYFGEMVKALGKRYDGHPDLELVDISVVGLWGEGEGMHLLKDKTRIALINCYLDNFKKTPLNFQPINGDAPDPAVDVKGTAIYATWPDGRVNKLKDTPSRYVGYRMDCIGDMTNTIWVEKKWSHMQDIYPKEIIRSGMSEVWKKSPVSMEICWTFVNWLNEKKYDAKTVEYIFNEALKWHISSFNAKSSPVPEVWGPLVDKWLNKMGYRFVVRKFEYPSIVNPQGQLPITVILENIGVAPIYKNYKFAVRLTNTEKTQVLETKANPLEWLPGDVLVEDSLIIPKDMPKGTYQIEVALVSPNTFEPRVKLAIEGINKEEWYTMGEIEVKKN